MSGARITKSSRSSTGVTAIAVGILGMVLSSMMRLQIGFPDTFSFITPEQYYQYVTMHGMIMVIYLC